MHTMEPESFETIAPAVFYEALYKIVIVGDSGVGKTNILNRYCRGTFLQEEKSTIGVEFATKVVSTPDGKRVKAQIWDTAGQERYRAITSAYYRGSLGAILVFSLTDPISFSHVTRWLSEVVDHTAPDIAVILIGTKSDLAEDRKVSRADAEKLGFPYFECSAKTGENVLDAVNKLIFAVHTQQLKGKSANASQSAAAVTLLRPAVVQDDVSEKSCCGF